MADQYEHALNLTTPLMHGQKVKDAQWLMAGHGKIKGLATYKDGAIDGVYGPLTAQATYRAKYWCGYPNSAIDRSFGQVLYEYLLDSSARKLPPDYLRRRQERLNAVAKSPGSQALAKAITQLGVRESPFGSNMQKFGSWYGMNGVPWCAIFVSWSFAQSGFKRFRYSYVPSIHDDARNVRNGLCVVRTPRPGDLACFTFGGVRDAHVEIVEKMTGSTFQSVGGNTGHTNYSNGGEVLRSTRYVSNVAAFVRVT